MSIYNLADKDGICENKLDAEHICGMTGGNVIPTPDNRWCIVRTTDDGSEDWTREQGWIKKGRTITTKMSRTTTTPLP